jgi:uncharacterized protein YkwD
LRSLFFFAARRWGPAALLCQALLIAVVGGPAASRPTRIASASEAGPQCMQADAPLFSEVLGTAAQPAVAAPTPAPQLTALPAPSIQPPTLAPPAATPQPAPVRHAIAPASPPPTLAPPEPTLAPPTATPVPAPAVASMDGCERIVALVNQVRRENGMGTLAYNSLLGAAAQEYADFLAAHDALSHTADGRTLDARAEAAGYTTWVALGENLAGGYTTFEEALDAWLASPGHRANILNPGFTETGTGCAWNANSAHGWFFVQEFGTR